jgi:PAS domain S-box-containing protein
VAERKHAEAALAKARDELEIRVQERTAELAEANRSLQAEIAERKRTGELLRQSEELHRITMENILDPLFITDDDGHFTFICLNVSHILGYTVKELQAKGNISALVGEELFSRNTLETRREIRNIERVIVDKKGNAKTYLISVKRVSIQGGTILYTCHDITIRKHAEEALQESEEKYRTLFEHLPIPVFTKNRAGEYTSCNAENRKYWTVDPIGRTDAELLDPETASVLRETDLRVMDTGETLTVEESLANTPLGTRQVLSRKMPLRDGNGHIDGILAASLDITERKQTEEALRIHHTELETQNEELRATQHQLEQSQQKYVDLYDFAPVGYCTLDQKGHFVETNLTMATLLGVARDTLSKTVLYQ